MSVLISGVIGGVIGVVFSYWFCRDMLIKKTKFLNKYRMFYWCLVRFVKVKQNGYSLGKELIQRNVKTIAIYGMKELGELLYTELKGSGIDVKYAIDRDADSLYSELKIIKPNEIMEKVDMVIVTVLSDNRDIFRLLNEMYDWRVVDINDALGWCKVD